MTAAHGTPDLLQVIEARLSEAIGVAEPSMLLALREVSHAFVQAGGGTSSVRLKALEQLAILAGEARKLPPLRRPSVIAAAVTALHGLVEENPAVAPSWSSAEPVLSAMA